MGRKTWQKDAKGRFTYFAYDERGRLSSRKLPGSQIERMTYDDLGRLQTKTDFNNKTTSYAYDSRGRLLSKTPDASLGQETVEFRYPDEFTKIARRGGLLTTYHYDTARGWLASVDTPHGTINYGYDVAGNRTSVQTVVGGNVTSTTLYDYDALTRVYQVRSGSGAILATYSYDENGNRTSLLRGNGVRTTYAYDEQNRLTGMGNRRSDASATLLSGFSYSLRADGKRASVQDMISWTLARLNKMLRELTRTICMSLVEKVIFT